MDYIVQIHSLEKKKAKGREGDSTWLNLVRWSLTGRLLYTKGVASGSSETPAYLVKGDYRSDQVKNTIFKLLFSKFKQRNETHVMRNDCLTYENNTEFSLWDGTV